MINPSLLDQAGDQRLDGVLVTKHLHYLFILQGMVGGQEAQELFSFPVVYLISCFHAGFPPFNRMCVCCT